MFCSKYNIYIYEWLDTTREKNLKCVVCSIYLYIFLCICKSCKSFSGIYLTKKTSINIRDPKLPEVGQLTDHHIWQLLHKLHLLRGFKAPRWNKDTHTFCITQTHWHTVLIFAVLEGDGGLKGWSSKQSASKNHRTKYLTSSHSRIHFFVVCLFFYCTAWCKEG